MTNFINKKAVTLLMMAFALWLIDAISLHTHWAQTLASSIIMFFASFGVSEIFKFQKNFSLNFLYGFLSLISLIIIFGSIIYYLHELNSLILWTMILAVSILAFKGALDWPKQNLFKKISPPGNWKKNLLIVAYLVTLALAFRQIAMARTDSYLLSPWETLSWTIFPLFLFSLIILFIINYYYQGKNFGLICLQYIFTLGLAQLIYKLGFGFDPFIHQATENHILQFGYILPKSVYYIGHYSLIIFLSKLSALSVVPLDRYLNLILMATVAPIAIASKFKFNYLAALIFLFLPAALLINSTPYSVGIFFLIGVIFLNFESVSEKISGLLLAMAACLIHPLAGLPTLVVWLFKIFPKLKSIPATLTVIVGATLIPLAFTVLSKLGGLAIEFNNSHEIIRQISDFQWLYWEQKHFPWRDLLYQYVYNINFILIALAIGAAWWRRGRDQVWNILLAAAALAISWLIVRFGFVFNSLINYERGAFSERIAYAVVLILSPLWIDAILMIIDKISHQKKVAAKIFLIILILLAAGASFYSTYPRRDDYENFSGYNTSQADFEAVAAIQNDAAGADYAVLAPQTTSAAALAQFGFSPEIKPAIYFFPIPTSGEWYQFYLRLANEHPDKTNIQAAKNYSQREKLYYVLPSYWANAGALFDASLSAGGRLLLETPEIKVFAF